MDPINSIPIIPISNTQPPQSTSTGAWANIKGFFVSAGSWIGRSVTWLATQVADFAVKVYEWAKPAFVALGRFIAAQWENARKFISEHKAETIIALAAFAIGAITSAAFHALCCNSKKSQSA